MTDSRQNRRAIVQKLESLHRDGVRSIPRSRVPARASAQTVSAPAPTPVVSTEAQMATSSKQIGQQPTEPLSAAIPLGERPAVLHILEQEVASCVKCHELAGTRRQTVFGVGNSNSRLVFLGEAPGADEDRQGEPFVGRAGHLLTKIIEACTLKREEVYILNVLKCRPPGNRNPSPEETDNCRPFFERQLDIVRPEFICCLGSIATKTLLETSQPIGRLRGHFHDWRGVKVLATYHPAYLLRNPAAKKLVWDDMKILMKEMGVAL